MIVVFAVPIYCDLGKVNLMFSDNLGFNPFDKSNRVSSNGYASKQKNFLASFGQNNILVYNGNPRKKISSMTHTSSLKEAIDANVNNHSDVYFYVNGGRKVYAIKEFTSCFCDMDAGRDNEGKYFKPSVVVQKKKQFLKKINEFPVPPTWVVDTRNGYQCYWIFDNQSRKIVSSNKTVWDGLQKKLVNYFGGDPRAIKANQIYRVPYTWWRKEWEKKAPYFTSILPGSSGKKINVIDLKSALNGQSATVSIVPDKCSDEWYKGYAKAYKQSDITGVPVSTSVSLDILNAMGQNKAYGDPTPVYSYNSTDAVKSLFGVNDTVDEDALQCDRSDLDGRDLNLDGQQTKLLKTVVEFLNQVSTPLYFSGNKFLSSAAKDLANQVSDKFCIG